MVFGGGTVGSGIAEVLSRKASVVIVDSDPEVVSAFMGKGVGALYGSADNPEIWAKASAERAKVVVLATPSAKPGLALLHRLKRLKKKPMIFARAHYYHDSILLYDAGADVVIMPHVIGSNFFIKRILQYLETGKIEELSEGYRDLFSMFLREKSREERRGPL